MGKVIYLNQRGIHEWDGPGWKNVSVPITIPDPGPKAWKQYRRGKKLFWRNYKRDVPGGITFIQRMEMLEGIARRAMEDYLTEEIFG